MLFNIVKYLIIFGLPFAVYGLWAFFARRRAEAGDEPLQNTPWIWLFMAGLVLMIGSLGVTGLMTGEGIEGNYVPPHLVNGVVVPSDTAN